MLNIDQYAYSNQLSKIHPMEKILFAIGIMIVCLVANSVYISLVVILLMAGVITLGARISVKLFIKLLAIPVSFLLFSILAIIISITTDESTLLWYVAFGKVKVGIQSRNLLVGINLFLRSLATVSCLYFLALTTPAVEIINIFKKLKLPQIFIELMMLMYRLLFILLETANQIRLSQLSRLGYTSFRNSLFSLSKLIARLFIKAYYRARELVIALEARGYDGEIRVLVREHQLSKRNLIAILLIEFLLIIVTIY
ncbi:cobalt/nickel transport system permease protein [Orenia metallireducens]|uniref:Cobalt/nickel transport system permease protein n=1 Tax=Orenia metallireducens TaxID=1413210 RepID=A0A285GNV3_9FIRM|nr:cobalt ECF transporter T component CbiQ [Orenia metallireducens]PRX29839.1 cobalt/nickel transport system permease protein [Orenia metallireducens]SNY25252.1 cobalt/nickel transport system permease protein [Orenia metallireducens]